MPTTTTMKWLLAAMCLGWAPLGQATLSGYEGAYHPTVQQELREIRQNKFEALLVARGATVCDYENLTEECCGIDTEEQGQWYTQNKALQCRVASADYTYLLARNLSEPLNFEEVQARAGDVVLGGPGGDSTFAPALLVPNCYYGLGCEEGEFCMVDVQVPQMPWSQGPGGATPNEEFCGDEANIERAQGGGEGLKTYELFCGDMPPDPSFQYDVVDYAYNPANDQPIYSKCVPYKKLHQPCEPILEYSSGFGPMWDYRAEDTPWSFDVYSQSFVCAPGLKCSSESADMPHSCIPEAADEGTYFETDVTVIRKEHESCDGDTYVCEDGLVCTPSEYYVLPNTCVVPREKDICFFGPWWNSNVCPRLEELEEGEETGVESPGLTWEQSLEAMKRFVVLFASDLMSSGDAGFWCPEQTADTLPNFPEQLRESREIVYNIIRALFPMELFPGKQLPTMEEILLSVITDEFYAITDNCQRNVNEILDSGSVEGSLLASILAKAAQMSGQPNQIWSLIHFMTFNLEEKITEEQVTASQALSTYLSQQFWCTDCRALYTRIVDVVSGPPAVATGAAHADFWWLAHNLASEHVATTTGGHPFTYNVNSQLVIPGSGRYSGQEVRALQNHFFMPYETAQQMWQVKDYDNEKEEDKYPEEGEEESDAEEESEESFLSDLIRDYARRGRPRGGNRSRVEGIIERMRSRLDQVRGED
jgi:hypothetical protein